MQHLDTDSWRSVEEHVQMLNKFDYSPIYIKLNTQAYVIIECIQWAELSSNILSSTGHSVWIPSPRAWHHMNTYLYMYYTQTFQNHLSKEVKTIIKISNTCIY